ncbi:MAG: protein deglycase HchA [Rhodothermaceae bacterium]|nr:protein deglycase HchA [Rhodothermaceae bacterium]
MLKSLLGIAPQQEPDGSFRPSKLALKLATSDATDYEPASYDAYEGERSKILVVFTEQKNMTMKNGRDFSTGNHPVEALVPMLHLRNAGFEFEITTPSGKPVVFEMWAMPAEDAAVMGLYEDLKSRFENPRPLPDVVDSLHDEADSYAAVFVPGGHGAMLGIPDDPNVGTVLRWANEHGLFTISLCHGPASFLATTLGGHDFLYAGYDMAVFPDAVDKKAPMIGYLPGPMPWQLGAKLESLGAKIVNTKADDTCHLDRTLITGASPDAADALGKLAATTLLVHRRPANRTSASDAE